VFPIILREPVSTIIRCGINQYEKINRSTMASLGLSGLGLSLSTGIVPVRSQPYFNFYFIFYLRTGTESFPETSCS
jgi:hypothetical protein